MKSSRKSLISFLLESPLRGSALEVTCPEGPIEPTDDSEFERRAEAPATEFVDADALLDAIEEHNEMRDRTIGHQKATRNAM